MPPNKPVCAESVVAATLSAWRDHMLSDGEWGRLARHVTTCAACQARLSAYDQDARALFRQRELEPGNRVITSVRERARARTRRPGAPDPRRRVWGALGGLAAVAAIVLLFELVLGPAFGPHPPTQRSIATRIPLGDPSYGVLAAVAAPDGGLWFTEERFVANPSGSGTTNGPSKISHVTPAGQLTEYPLPDENTIGVDPVTASDLTLDADANPWFVERQGGLVHTAPFHYAVATIDGSGAIREFRLPFPESIFFVPSVTTPLVLTPDGNLWFGVNVAIHLGTTPSGTTSTIELARITPAGTITGIPLSHIPSGAQLNQLILGPDGNLWAVVQEFDRNGTAGATVIARITLAGAVTTYAPPTADVTIGGLTVGHDGNLWFVEQLPGTLPSKLGRITPTGAISEYTLAGQPGTLAYTLAPGTDANVWFTAATSTCTATGPCQPARGAVGRITASGAIAEYPLPARGVIPLGLVAGPGGDLYFVEVTANGSGIPTGNDKLGRVTPTGTITEFGVATRQGSTFQLVSGNGNTLWLATSPAQGQPGNTALYRIAVPGT